MLAIAHNNNEDAYNYYEKAFSMCPNNAMVRQVYYNIYVLTS